MKHVVSSHDDLLDYHVNYEDKHDKNVLSLQALVIDTNEVD